MKNPKHEKWHPHVKADHPHQDGEREAKLPIRPFLGIKLEPALGVGEGGSSTCNSKGSGSTWNLRYHPAYPFCPQNLKYWHNGHSPCVSLTDF